MAPSYVIRLEELPLNPAGKTDRRALRELEVRQNIQAEYVAPRTEVEKKLAHTWSEFLGIERPGIQDNFFNIGGDSIKSISLLTVINREFNTALELVDLYENETIEKLALKIDGQQETPGETTGEYGRVLGELDALKQRILKGNKNR
jgi:acyl carrier protein